MGKLERLLAGDRPPGLYRLSADMDLERMRLAAKARGWRVFHLDGRRVVDKASFLLAAAKSLEFPTYFGHNWDAFEELLTDLSWAPAAGYLLLYDHPARFARSRPREWVTARAILEEAVAYWRRQGTPLVVLLRHARRIVPDVPWL
jgi:hypothetical protein